VSEKSNALYWSTDFSRLFGIPELPSNTDVMMSLCPVPQPHFTASIYAFSTPCSAAKGVVSENSNDLPRKHLPPV